MSTCIYRRQSQLIKSQRHQRERRFRMATAEEMLQAQAHVLHHVMGHMGSMSLKCAVQLEIPDIIHAHGHPMTIPQLLAKLPVSPDKAPFIRRFMHILTQMGYFKVHKVKQSNTGTDGDDAYSITAMSAILLKDNPASFRSWLLGTLGPFLMNNWQVLSAWLQSERPVCTFEYEHGRSLWDLSEANPEFNSFLNEFMAADTRLVMSYVVDKCGAAFEGLSTLVDVGGGNGTAARTIARAFPNLKCTVYDLPHVIASIPEGAPLVDAVGGSMFEHIPNADAIFLKLILHDWSDEECVKILSKCRNAIPAKSGKVIIIDIVLKDRENAEEVETQYFWDMTMLTATNGKERHENEWRKLFMEAGFANYKITRVGLRSLIEVFP